MVKNQFLILLFDFIIKNAFKSIGFALKCISFTLLQVLTLYDIKFRIWQRQ